MGKDKYMQIIQQLGGNTIYFPNDVEWTSKDERNMELRNDFYSGRYEVSEIAMKYGLSVSTVYKIIQRKDD